MKIKITKKNKLITESLKNTKDFILFLIRRHGFSWDRSDKNIDHSRWYILKKKFGKKHEEGCTVEVKFKKFRKGGLLLANIFTPEECRGKGYAREVMQMITKNADFFGVRIDASFIPTDESTDVDELIDFGTSLGFEQDFDDDYLRYPDKKRYYRSKGFKP